MNTDAVVFVEPRKVEVRQVCLPDVGDEDVLIEMEYSFISTGAERWCLTGMLREPGKPPMTPFPHIPGYQAAGVVREAGRRVKGLAPGDRVFNAGTRVAAGWQGSSWGGHAHYHVADYRSAIKLPENVDTLAASGLLLAQVGYNGASKPRLAAGDPVVVIGDGLVGQWAGQAFRARGAHVIMSGHHPSRLAAALRYSADEVVDATTVDLPAFIRQRYPDGVPVAAETASSNALVRTAIDMLTYEGQLVLLGYYPEGECLIDIHWIRARETTVLCPNASKPERMAQTLKLVADGKMHIKEMVTHTFPSAAAPDAYRLLLEKPSEFLGIVISWRQHRRHIHESGPDRGAEEGRDRRRTRPAAGGGRSAGEGGVLRHLSSLGHHPLPRRGHLRETGVPEVPHPLGIPRARNGGQRYRGRQRREDPEGGRPRRHALHRRGDLSGLLLRVHQPPGDPGRKDPARCVV
jgi:bacteriochlorophyllide a dehydrogenase